MTDAAPLPSVSVVVATRDRPQLLAEALAAILGQRYAGPIEVLAVFDQAVPDHSLAREEPGRTVRVLENVHTPGLAGARNTGIEAATGDYLAFCDDDDTWLPEKLAEQIGALERTPEAVASVTGIVVDFRGRHNVRVPRAEELNLTALYTGRVAAAHPSSYVMRASLRPEVGLVDEEIPGSYGEDYDWLLRWVERGPVAVVELPLVRVRWGASSYFADRWQTMADAMAFLIEKHPGFRTSPRGMAYMWGKRAFALAAAGNAADARVAAREAIGFHPLEPRSYLALAVSWGLLSPAFLVRTLNARGKGI